MVGMHGADIGADALQGQGLNLRNGSCHGMHTFTSQWGRNP